MSLTQALLGEFDHEMASTRRMLEAIPDDQLAWKPHEKSFSLADLALHIAEIPGWPESMLGADHVDISGYQRPQAENVAAILANFDDAVGRGRAAIAGLDAEEMGKPWALRNGDQVIFEMPKGAVYRSMVMNHLVHHRGQLSVYVRLLGKPVTSTYGPTADEGHFG